jgi:hypothetical protein
MVAPFSHLCRGRIFTLPLLSIILLFRMCAPPPKILTISPNVTLKYGQDWDQSEQKFSHGFELVRTNPDETRPGGVKPPFPSHLARIVITTEQRLSQADAQQRLRDVARSRTGTATFYAIGGWPAVELRFLEQLPEKGIKDGTAPAKPLPTVSRALVAIAAATLVVDFDISLAPSSKPALLDDAIGIAQSTTFASKADPEELSRIIAELEQWAKAGQPQTRSSPRPKSNANGGPQLNVNPGPPTGVQPGVGELEIVASADASKIAIASNSGLTFSTNSGANYSNGNPGTFGLNDPTVARGVSGNFYLGGITFPSNVLGFTGCADGISTSTDGGANFAPTGFSAKCPTTGSICAPDQPHIAADSFGSSAQGRDQLYAVWRDFTPTPCLSCPSTCNAVFTSDAWQTSMIACSQDSGANWNLPTPIAGGGDHPRVAVGADGKVYVVTIDGNSVKLGRYASCSEGLALDAGFPVTVADDAGVDCAEPGLDRCDDSLSSQMVAPDPGNASHVFVSYARKVDDGGKFEWILVRESNDGGLTFSGDQIVSATSKAHRFMPWSCSTFGSVFTGWYDRSAALGGTTNDLTDYVVGSPIFPGPVNLSVNPDPQCASGWPVAPQDQNDSNTCTVQPQNAGRCQNGSGGGSNTACDFNNSHCPSGESCKTGRGAPKYGDYNGIGCAGNNVIGAWASATAPPGLPAPGGISVFSRVIPLVSPPTPTWDRIRIDITTGQDDLRSSSEAIATVSSQSGSGFCLKPSTSRSPDSTCANGSGAKDQTGRDHWQNSDGVISQTFTLPTPQASAAGFGTMTITLLQGSCFACTSDNWNIEDIAVTAIDSTSVLPPTFLLSVTSSGGGVSDKSCIARLKDSPNAVAVTFSLASPPTNTHVYVGGPSSGATTTCKNNGD